MRQSSGADVPARAATLARDYINALASTTRRDVLGGPDQGLDATRLRSDLTAVAVLAARMIASEPGLARRLRMDSPVVAVQSHTAEITELVGEIFEQCVTHPKARKKIIVRDGTERSHTPEKGNAEVMLALNGRWPVVGVAPNPKRQLPSALIRMSEYWLSIPPLDEWSLRLVLEAVTGTAYTGPIEANLVRNADLSDISLSFRWDLSPGECLKRLATLVKNKAAFLGDGPKLEELAGYGAAQDWGLELTADLADYRSGRIGWDEVGNKALLLSGPPGTGKSSYAKALARSAGVPLIATSVAEWNSATYLSGTLKAIRTVFGEAKGLLLVFCSSMSSTVLVAGRQSVASTLNTGPKSSICCWSALPASTTERESSSWRRPTIQTKSILLFFELADWITT